MFVYHHIVSSNHVLQTEHFRPDYWHSLQSVSGTSGGRNKVYFVTPKQEEKCSEWVLRHYYRGGLPGRFLKDQFFFLGYNNTRAVREFNLLEKMRALDLPVPEPIAAHVARFGVVYRSDILVARIPGATDLGRFLLQQELDNQRWQAIGAMLRRFHSAGVSHVDLNCKNIMWQEEKQQAWLIDFDRCAIRKPAERWQNAQLARLHRSFEKEQRIASQTSARFFWNAACWQQLLTGYRDSK